MENCLGDTLTAWRTSGAKCSMVELAISTMAFAVFARAQSYPHAAIQASTQYSNLLRILQHRIGSSMEEHDIHACILTVLIISRYEGAHPPPDLTEYASFTSTPKWSHHDGIVALLRLWYDSFRYSRAMFVVKQSRKVIMRSYMLRVLPLPEWLLDGELFGEAGLDLEYDRLNVRLINLRYMTSVVLYQLDSNKLTKANELDAALAQLESDLQAWATLIPSIHTPSPHTLPDPAGPLPRKHIHSASFYSFRQPGHGAVWTRYYTARMLIASSRLQIREALLSDTFVNSDIHLQASTEHLVQICFMAESIMSSIPFSLGVVRINPSMSPSPNSGHITLTEHEEIRPYQANLVLWPLMVGSGLKGIDVDQRRWFRSELAEVGKVLGDGMLERAEWATF